MGSLVYTSGGVGRSRLQQSRPARRRQGSSEPLETNQQNHHATDRIESTRGASGAQVAARNQSCHSSRRRLPPERGRFKSDAFGGAWEWGE